MTFQLIVMVICLLVLTESQWNNQYQTSAVILPCRVQHVKQTEGKTRDKLMFTIQNPGIALATVLWMYNEITRELHEQGHVAMGHVAMWRITKHTFLGIIITLTVANSYCEVGAKHSYMNFVMHNPLTFITEDWSMLKQCHLFLWQASTLLLRPCSIITSMASVI